jgi:iron complex transport system ATP-binding protein
MASARALVAEGKTVISVLHELNAALAADAMVVMAKGRVLHHGRCDDPATHQALEAVFDGRVAVHRVAGHWMAVPH